MSYAVQFIVLKCRMVIYSLISGIDRQQGGTWVTGSQGHRIKTRPFLPGPGQVPGQDLGAGPGPGLLQKNGSDPVTRSFL